jgi:thiamine-monophosphate kinase
VSSDKAEQASGHTALREGTEFDLVRRMLNRWSGTAREIGDDAAVLAAPVLQSLVVSTDISVENVHFRRGWLKPKEIGYRATAAALSDLAAMAAEPLGILVALILPAEWRDRLDEIADGIGEAADGSSTGILGGDLSDGRDLSLAITVLGRAANPLRRSGARAGDRVYVTGKLGGPGAALLALTAGKTPSRDDRARFAHPVPRIRESLWLAAHGVTSAIDVSDGLAADLSHVAAASNVAISISLDRIPVMSGVSPNDAAGSGEEYELAVTSSAGLDTRAFSREFDLPLTEIGAVEAGRPTVRVFDHGAPVPTPTGYLHFKQ